MTISPSSSFVPTHTIVLIGMMGVGKSSVGRKLAARLALPFFDADDEIEKAAGMPVKRIFADYGEPEFRRLERRVIARLLDGPMHVLSTGGGAFMDDGTRALIQDKAVSIWLTAKLDILIERTMRRDDRPLLKNGDPRDIMTELLATRAPIYAEANITVESDDRPVEETVTRALNALAGYAS
jgi:shikimate kinase